ncbi:MAG: ATP-sensitive inward rectifier potassium channel 10 [Deltaproteobacteria bacterium]|nr:ATP-sensitive inward rectifier potassium channel 10 [Deltaproteobacteria bacterium]
MRSRRRSVLRADGYEVHAVGMRGPELRDLYHWLLRIPWWAMGLVIVAGWLALNVAFACLYVVVGGVANAAPGSFSDAFFFSIQTMGTIGYGAMAPASSGANVLTVVESVVGLLVTALATGLVFARFSQTRARVVFSELATISPMDGVPTLAVRLGNDWRSAIVDATFRLVLSTTVKLAEGQTFYRSQDLVLVRDRASALSRAWLVLHRLDATSPLHGLSPEDLRAADAEISLSVLGLDELSMQPAFARHVWDSGRIVHGARLADILSETPEGNMLVDLGRFHDIEPTPATTSFPYGVTSPPPPAPRRTEGDP